MLSWKSVSAGLSARINMEIDTTRKMKEKKNGDIFQAATSVSNEVTSYIKCSEKTWVYLISNEVLGSCRQSGCLRMTGVSSVQ